MLNYVRHYFLGYKAFYLNEPISTFCHALNLKSSSVEKTPLARL